MEHEQSFPEDFSGIGLSHPHAASELELCDSITQIGKASHEDIQIRSKSSRTRNGSSSISDDNDDEKKEKRRKQKRDYAARRRKQDKHNLHSLEQAHRKLGRRSKRRKQQIERLKTWAMYAKSYLSLCYQLVMRHPAAASPHSQPSGVPGDGLHTLASPEPKVAPSACYSPASSASSSGGPETSGTSVTAVKGNTRANDQKVDQSEDPNWEWEGMLQTVSSGVNCNFFPQGPTIVGDATDLDGMRGRDLLLLLSDCLRGPLPVTNIDEMAAWAASDCGTLFGQHAQRVATKGFDLQKTNVIHS